jgi:signal transduction histidine kinase
MAILHVKIAARLTLGLILLAGLTLAVSAIAFLVFNALRQDFDEIARRDLPVVTATAQLSRQAQSIAAGAPALVVADSQFTRQTLAHRMTDEFAALDRQIRELKAFGIEGERFDTLVALRDSLMAALNGLDQSVEQKLDLEQAAHGHFQRLVSVQDELQRLASLPESRKAAAGAWLADAEQTAASLFGSFGISQPALLDAARIDIDSRLAVGEAVAADLGGDFGASAGIVQRTLREIADGGTGLLTTRASELAVTRLIAEALGSNKAFADRFDETATTVARSIEDGILTKSDMVRALIMRQTRLVAALALFCVCGAALVLVYVRRSVIRRLHRLQEAMQSYVAGAASTIETQGTDELADMARALEFFVRTISEREAALAASESRLRSVTENLPGAVFRLIHRPDDVLVITYLSPGIRDLLNLSPAALVNRPDAAFELVPPAEQARLRAAIERSVDDHVQLFFEYQAAPLTKWIRFMAFPRAGEPGETIWDGLMLDSTEWKQADLAKRAFVSTVSHELRTPLSSIQGSLGLVAGGAMGELPDGAKRLIDIANTNCQRLTRLINDILDIERIEQSHIAFAASPQALAPLLVQAVDSNRGHGLARNVTLVLAEPPAALAVDVDSDRFMQVMTNLLSNAVKHSPDGGQVEIGATASERSVRLFVRDHGGGIPRAFRPYIFDRFTQADNSDRRARSGTGLGLNIARAIVERFGGKLSFETAEGIGTTFLVELPISTTPPLPAPLRILHLDGDEERSRVLSMLLGEQAEILPARSAAEAARLLDQEPLQLVILHLDQPGGAARSLLDWLRKRGLTHPIPLLAIGEAQAELPGRAIRLPATVSHAELMREIEAMLERSTATTSP